MKGNLRKDSILDSTSWITDSRCWIPDSLSVELGFRIPNSGFQSVVGFRILELNSTFQFSKPWIPDCASKKIPDSEFHK